MELLLYLQSNKKYRIIFYIYLALWVFYVAQDAFIGAGAMISKLILAGLLAYSIVLFCIDISERECPFVLKILTFFILTVVVCGLEIGATYTTHEFGIAYIKQAFTSFLPIYGFYYFAKKGVMGFKDFRLLTIPFFLIIILCYYKQEANLLQKAFDKYSNQEEFTNNMAYYFIYLVPYLYFFKRKFSYVIVVFIAAFLIIGMKRGAILTGGIGIILYFNDSLKNQTPRNRILAIIGIAIFFLIIFNYAQDEILNSERMQARIEDTLEGESSGRDDLLYYCWRAYIYDFSLIQQLFGAGPSATFEIAGNYAHNDWMEVLIDQGIFGVIVMSLFIYTLWKVVLKSKEINLTIFRAFRNQFLIFLFPTFFSMSIFNILPFSSLLLGYFIGATCFPKETVTFEEQ